MNVSYFMAVYFCIDARDLLGPFETQPESQPNARTFFVIRTLAMGKVGKLEFDIFLLVNLSTTRFCQCDEFAHQMLDKGYKGCTPSILLVCHLHLDLQSVHSTALSKIYF